MTTDDETLPKIGICCICGQTYDRWGNNAWPVADGRCCHGCDQDIVMPARLKRLGLSDEGVAEFKRMMKRARRLSGTQEE
jgi:hypothetical protein